MPYLRFREDHPPEGRDPAGQGNSGDHWARCDVITVITDPVGGGQQCITRAVEGKWRL